MSISNDNKLWADYSDEEHSDQDNLIDYEEGDDNRENHQSRHKPKNHSIEKVEYIVFSDAWWYTEAEVQLRNVFNSLQAAIEWIKTKKYHIYCPNKYEIYEQKPKQSNKYYLHSIVAPKDYCERTQIIIEKSILYQHFQQQKALKLKSVMDHDKPSNDKQEKKQVHPSNNIFELLNM